MAHLDREGRFRATIEDYHLNEATSGAVGVSLVCKITAAFDGSNNTWEDWTGFEEQLVFGDVWLLKKDKQVNKKSAESLAKCAGWGGTFSEIVDRTWQPKPVQITVAADTYNGETRYKIQYINDYDSTGQASNVDVSKAKQFDSLHGPTLRAIVGTNARAAKKPAPSSKPVAPPPKAAPTAADTDCPF